MYIVCLLGSLTLVLRNFAKNLEGWLDTAMVNVAPDMVQAKVVITGSLFLYNFHVIESFKSFKAILFENF